MRLELTILRSRVGRRLLTLFVLCALLPVGTLAFLALDQVSEHLYAQSDERLRQVSKASGLELLDRLLELEAELAALAESGRVPSSGREALTERFRWIARVDAGGAARALLGTPSPFAPLDSAQQSHLASGRSLLIVREAQGAGAAVVMVRSLAKDSSSAPLLVGETDPEWLFDLSYENTLSAGGEFCVLDERGWVIASSWASCASSPGAIREAARASGRAGFTWREAGGEVLAGTWSLFLKGLFAAPEWTILVAEPKQLVLAPVEAFRTIFPLVALATLCAVVLVSVAQIRRSLRPLEALREATRRIARRDFDVDVRIRSGDEFEELADSFNAMAGRLHEHFDLLATLIEIDREVLSAADAPGIARAVLARVAELYPCDWAAVLLREGDGIEPARRFAVHVATRSAARVEHIDLSGDDLEALAAQPEGGVVPAAEARAYLRQLAGDRFECFLLLPIVLREEVAGLVVLGHGARSAPDPERVTYARQLVDQAATSLSNARANEEKRLLAYYDTLTGLPNRLLFKERLGQALERARAGGLAVLYVELDDFQRINDTLGPSVGDELLKQVGRRIGEALRDGSIARLGGDEYAVLLDSIASFQGAGRTAERVLEAIARPIDVSGREILVTASIGISVYPQDGDSVEALLQNADTAVYHAKGRGKNCHQFFSETMNSTARQRLDVEQDLRRAVERDELRLFFQPVVAVATRDLLGFEALLRWQHPRRGLVSPASFIGIAEETGLIVPIGAWVLRAACAQNRAWQRAGLPFVRVAVNLSPRQFADEGLLDEVRAVLAETGLGAEYLSFEFTESTIGEVDEKTLGTLHALREMGLSISLDDFGTGYSSLSYLKRMPVDTLKIDRAFVKGLPGNTDDAAIARAVIAMGHSLGMKVLAEGVETEHQLAFLRAEGCDAAQGFLFAEPLAPDAAAKRLERSRAAAGA